MKSQKTHFNLLFPHFKKNRTQQDAIFLNYQYFYLITNQRLLKYNFKIYKLNFLNNTMG